MGRKISLEEFQQIKKQLIDILNSNNFFAVYEFGHLFYLDECKDQVMQYVSLLAKLTSFDISDIPYEEWQGLRILVDNNHIANFSNYQDEGLEVLKSAFGKVDFPKIFKMYPDVFIYLLSSKKVFKFQEYLAKYKTSNSEEKFIKALKSYVLEEGYKVEYLGENGRGEIFYKFPDWMSSVNLRVVDKITTLDDLLSCDYHTIILNKTQNRVIDELNIENIKRFEQEFEGNQSLRFFTLLTNFFEKRHWLPNGYEFTDSLSYNEFKDKIAKLLDYIRHLGFFGNHPNYSFLHGSFREDYPEIFISETAPQELQNVFYRNAITIDLLVDHPGFIPYIKDYNLSSIISDNICLGFKTAESGEKKVVFKNFIQEFVTIYGQDKFWRLIKTYGKLLSNIQITITASDFADEMKLTKAIRKAIYKNICDKKLDYSHLQNVLEMVREYPSIFLDFDELLSISASEKVRLAESFYSQNLEFADVQKYPELIRVLKGKNLKVAFNNMLYKDDIHEKYNTVLFLASIGNTNFLKLCAKYGNYLNCINDHLKLTDKNISWSDISKRIEEIIASQCLNGYIDYSKDDAPTFLLQEHPELFLNDDAPEDLKKLFYGTSNNGLTFKALKEHPEWFSYLIDKSIATAIIRGTAHKDEIHHYFLAFGKKALPLGLQKPEVVMNMIDSQKTDLMKAWYNKTNQRFIPDSVVMLNFPLEEADKFLLASTLWSKLMRIVSFAENYEAREAMLKLAYTFGVFEHDQRGLKKLLDILTGIPKIIKSDDVSSITCDPSKLALLQTVYQLELDGSYKLRTDVRTDESKIRTVRQMLESIPDSPVLTPSRAHQLFGSFSLKYDKAFRDFLLENWDIVINSPEYTKTIAKIQRNFSQIKAANSNRKLTWDLAVSFLENNKYQNIETGNESVAEISAIAGYSQEDFAILQQIYNYGRKRVFSSIPRIENKKGKYSYEILRLDDPLALAIGTLSDCCQELGDMAEICMEHSMVDNNGRIFVIRDEFGNIVAQSWVWRNQDVICFDNIEIPNKAFARAVQEDIAGREKLAQDVYDIYKQAAEELMQADEKTYHWLWQTGRITKEQYDNWQVGKVTVGLGYNDIAEVIKRNALLDKEKTTPLPFNAPVKLDHGLYIKDSNRQYILIKKDKQSSYNTKAPFVHQDTFIEYDDASFTSKLAFTLTRLEAVTKGRTYDLNTELDSSANKHHLVTAIADNYGLDPLTTKIVLHPNFAIVYDTDSKTIQIADLFFNTNIHVNNETIEIEEKVLLQLHLAIKQISKGRMIDVSSLNAEQRMMYEKAVSLDKELDIESGVKNAR